MSKLFAFIPTAQWGVDAAETLIRFGHSKHGVEKFTGPLEPRLPLLMCVPVKDGQEASLKLKQILRGNEPYNGERSFNLHTSFRTTRAGDNYFTTLFTKQELFLIFDSLIARKFVQEEEQPPVEFQPGEGEADVEQPGAPEPGEPEGEVVQMRVMSSAQAAAILCGIPGSLEAVLNN